MATTIGKGDWGIDADETGLIVQSIDFDYQNQSKDVLNREGEVIGKSYYQETCAISIEAWVSTDTPYSTAIGSALTMTNSVPDFLQAGVTGGSTIVENVTVNHAGEDYKQISIQATLYPYLTA